MQLLQHRRFWTLHSGKGLAQPAGGDVICRSVARFISLFFYGNIILFHLKNVAFCR
jgi:hypothetical protein